MHLQAAPFYSKMSENETEVVYETRICECNFA